MEIFDGYRALFRPLVAPAVALGNFDGVHLGHRALLDRAVATAAARDADATVLTFAPHPAQVLVPDRAPKLICTRERKLELIQDAGIDVCIVEPFTPELAALSPEDFLQTIIVDVIGARDVIVGYDFTFGKQRAGTTEVLRQFGARAGFTTTIVDAVSANGIIASSSTIRRAISAGDMAAARALLGRNFDLDGTVVRGAGRGRTIGIPTANLRFNADLPPPPGVYAARARLLDSDTPTRTYPAVANFGTNPTFVPAGEISFEVHLLDFDRDLYNQNLRVELVEYLRDETRFDSVDALVAQIHVDIETARPILDGPSHP